MNDQTPRAGLPGPLLLLFAALVIGGAVETWHVVRREKAAVVSARSRTRDQTEIDWALRGLDPKAKAEVQSLLDARSTGQREFHWLYLPGSARPDSMVKRYLAASLLYPRLLHRRVAPSCAQDRQKTPVSGMVDECSG